MKVGALCCRLSFTLLGLGASVSQDAAVKWELAKFFEHTTDRFVRALEEAAGEVTGSPKEGSPARLTIGIVTSPAISSYAAASTKNWEQYAQLHGYNIKVVQGGVDEACGPVLSKDLQQKTGRWAPVWAKICLLRSLLREHSKDSALTEQYVMVVDADTFVQHPEFNILDDLTQYLQAGTVVRQRADGLMFDDRINVNDYPGCWFGGAPPNGEAGTCRPNTFLMLFRSCTATLQFAESWLRHALGDCVNDARDFPPTQRVLWNCLLPDVERERPGWLHVMNGMSQYYTISLHEPELPLVHFEEDKRNLRSVKRAIARVQPAMHK